MMISQLSSRPLERCTRLSSLLLMGAVPFCYPFNLCSDPSPQWNTPPIPLQGCGGGSHLEWRVIATPPQLGLDFFSIHQQMAGGFHVFPFIVIAGFFSFCGTCSTTRCAVCWGLHSISHLLLITKEIIRNGDHGNWPAAYRLAGNALIYSVSKPQRATTL